MSNPKKSQPKQVYRYPKKASYKIAPVQLAKRKNMRYPYLAPGMSAIGGVAGGYLGGPQSALIGSALGHMAGSAISELTGYGDYKIKQNVLMTGKPPSIKNKHSGGGSVVVSHKEYIGDIISSPTSNTFSIQKFPIQPGVSATFPWMSQIAQNFQEYRIEGMIFQFRSMSADALNSTNTALGNIVMATSYNPSQPDFSSKAEMENAEFSQSIKPSESCLHFIECARNSNVLSELYVRSDDVTDPKFYDLGNFYIATNGFQGTSVNAGELWVSYQIALLKPKLYQSIGESINFYSAYTTFGIGAGLPLGTGGTGSYTVSVNSNINVVINTTLQTVTMPPSAAPESYFMRLFWRGTRTASLDPPATAYTNAVTTQQAFVTSSTGTTSTAIASPDTNAASLSIYLIDNICFQTVGNGKQAVITFSGGTLPGAPGASTVFSIMIMQIPNTYSFN